MRAAVQRAAAGPLLLADVAVDAPGPREVLVRTAAAGVCHSDAFALEGRFAFALPAVMGHESAGVVEPSARTSPTSRPATTSRRACRSSAATATLCVGGRP